MNSIDFQQGSFKDAFLDLIPASYFLPHFLPFKKCFFTRIFSSLVATDSESGRNSPQYNGNSHDLVNGKVSSLLTKTMENIQLTKQ